jgi:hypothetical protein
MMNAHRVEATVKQDGSLTLDGIPFQAGEEVEVIILARAQKRDGMNAYPLRGQPVRYDEPTAPVAEEEWGVLR